MSANGPAKAPTLDEIEAARARLGERVRETPVWRWDSRTLEERLGPGTQVFLKLELFQHAGSFKPRGALMVMLSLSREQLERGIVTVSAGNHAMAAAYAARTLGTTAVVAMPQTANPARVAACRALGADVRLVENVHR